MYQIRESRGDSSWVICFSCCRINKYAYRILYTRFITVFQFNSSIIWDDMYAMNVAYTNIIMHDVLFIKIVYPMMNNNEQRIT